MVRRVGTVLCDLGTVFTFDECHNEYGYGMRVYTAESEWCALVGRHLAAPEFAIHPRVFNERFNNVFVEIVTSIGEVRMLSWRAMLASRPPSRRRRYAFGVRQVIERGHWKSDARVECMLKLEFSPTSKLELREDRCIQYRTLAYNAQLARYLVPIEHRLYGHPIIIGSCRLWVVKGMSPAHRACLVDHLWRSYGRPYCLMADHSRFDRSVTQAHLAVEHSIYNACYRDRRLAELLREQLLNRGAVTDRRTKEARLRYVAAGKRMSGDVNTALGNCLINAVVLCTYACGVNSDVVIDGDDSLIITDRWLNAGGLRAHCEAWGFCAEVEVARRRTAIEFCQCKLLPTTDGPQFVRNPRKVIDLLQISCRRLKQEEIDHIFQAKVMAVLGTVLNIPVLTPIAWALWRGQPRFESHADRSYFEAVFCCWQGEPHITPETRSAFASAFNISPDEQLLIEEKFKDRAEVIRAPYPAEPPESIEISGDLDDSDGAFDLQPIELWLPLGDSVIERNVRDRQRPW